jgi:hypothetical protein
MIHEYYNRYSVKGIGEIMGYEVINEELKVAACSVCDLTLEMTQSILKNWPDGISIKELTVFTDSRSGYLVLNKESDLYDVLLATAEKYLSADTAGRNEIIENIPDMLRGSLIIMQKFRINNVVKREIFYASRGCIKECERRVLKEILCKAENPYSAVMNAFRYGVIRGKRTERRRKAGAVNEAN